MRVDRRDDGIPGRSVRPGATLAAVHEERCTALHGVPTMFIAELDHPEFAQYDLTTSAHGHHGRLAVSDRDDETRRRRQMHLREITIAYGMTETSPVSFQSSTDDPLDKRTTDRRPHSAASRSEDRRCRLGNIVPVGETGELCTRGYSVMHGYWGDDERTREAIVDGWMHTGDLATLDEEGYCNIVGRLKDMLIRGGENVYPREIEEFLFRHPKVQSRAGVRRAGSEVRRGSVRVDRRASRRTGDARTRSATSAKDRSRITRFRAISASSTRCR